MIVLDPPAFAKSKGALENAYRGYKEINLRALKCLPPGGFLVTCSCSQHMTDALFRRMVAEAAADAGRRVREVYTGAKHRPSRFVGCAGIALPEMYFPGGVVAL